ncbi:glycosyltransferase family 2 protein, partial [Corynebacterium heidelbergense]
MVAPHSERFALRAEDSVAAVIVTHRRADQLRHSLELVANQSKPVSHVIVVDNGREQAVQETVQQLCGDRGVYLPSATNLGGAGAVSYTPIRA